MKKIKILLSTIVGLLSVGALATGFTYAWLSTATTIVNFDNAGGGIISSYFHCGRGTESDPYVITRPVHLYNLVELMYANAESFQVYDKYFQLGYDLDGDDETLEFYTYNDYGVLQEDSYSNVLNMKYYSGNRALLPIGQYDPNDSNNHIPFSGVFDGSDLTIANLEIVGGSGIDDLGFFGYVTSDASIHNLYLDNLTINVAACASGIHSGQNLENGHAENANVGYIAGHIENSNCFDNVYVNNSTITGTGAVKIHNDWGYFGRCDNAQTLENFIGHAGIEDPSWGGSVNMQKMYRRLYNIAGRGYATRNENYVFEKDLVTKYDNSGTFERNALTGVAYTYRSRLEGSFVFSRYSDNTAQSRYMYLNGGTRYHQRKQTAEQISGFYISYNNNYLGVNGTNVAAHQDAWVFQNNRLSTTIDNQTYYLTHDLTLSTTSTDTWTRNNNKLYYTTTSGFIFTTTVYHYINYNNGWRVSTQNNSSSNAPALTWTQTTTIRITGDVSNGDDYMDYTGTNVTYFPLITEENNYNVAGKNTGYVVGGSEDNTTNAYPDKTGDIRVSEYYTSDISNSYSNKNLTNVYTINASNTTVKINNSNSSSFEKYLNSRSDFLSMITDGNIYGLHFMPANISQDHLVTADYALINGREKTNYQMPASSIDFNLATKGTINFFAGTYFSGNNSFFSLHHVERDDDDNISSIKEIDAIYKSTNGRKKYIYQYSDETYSGELDETYSLAFSTSRIKTQESLTLNAVYYFEIPVNAGEYALGSVDGGTGAYLMYLDIGSNGGIDFNADVDSFGSVEYRSRPDVATASLVLITYQQAENQTVNLKVVYKKQSGVDVYEITYSGTIEQITITVLSTEIEVYFNGEMLPQLQQSNIRSGTTT